MDEQKKIVNSHAVRGLLSAAGGVASLWPFLAPEIFSSIALKFTYFFIVLIAGVLIAAFMTRGEDPSDGNSQ